MLRQHRHDTVICSEKQNCRKCNTLFVSFRIFKYKPAGSEHFFIRHVNPRMVLVIYPRHSPCPIHQVVAKAGNRDSRIYLIHKIRALLTGIKVENHVRIICDIDVRLIIAVKNSPCITINSFPNWNIDIKNTSPIDLIFFWSQIKRRIHFSLIVDRCNKIFLHLLDTFFINTENRAVIFYAQENMTAIPIGKRTNGIVDVFRDIRCRFFEFDGQSFTLTNQFHQIFGSIITLTPFMSLMRTTYAGYSIAQVVNLLPLVQEYRPSSVGSSFCTSHSKPHSI